MKIDFDHWKGAQIGDDIQINLAEHRKLQIIEALKPKLTKDGNQFCFLYGELPNDCVVGFGDTASAAMDDFCNNFWMEKAVDASVERKDSTS